MNLDDKKTKPGRFPEATDTTSTPLDDRQNRKTRLGFKATDFVIYPAAVKELEGLLKTGKLKRSA